MYNIIIYSVVHFYQHTVTENVLAYVVSYIQHTSRYIICLMELIHFKVIDFYTHSTRHLLRLFTSITLFSDNDDTFNYYLYAVCIVASFEMKNYIAYYP